MLGFPVPYPNELIYSTIARAGVHDGDTSPKQLLDLVFGDRKVIATIDLPAHLQCIADQYPESIGLDVKALIKRHTLLPLYYPFLPKHRTEKIISWMRASSNGSAHLATGMAASRVKAKSKLFACPTCVKEQKSQYGEAYWDRAWQAPLLKCCPQHGPLYTTDVRLNGEHRHAYISLTERNILKAIPTSNKDVIFCQQVGHLLSTPDLSDTITYEQWSEFYRNLSEEYGFKNGKRIDHEGIRDQVVNFWGIDWLGEANLMPLESESSWLRAVFRKHRKSFSFAEHIVVMQALSGGVMDISGAIKKASNIKYKKEKFINHVIKVCSSDEKYCDDQNQWVSLRENHGAKNSRKLNPALYARLYRNHYDWLIKINQDYHVVEQLTTREKIDWQQRDRETAKILRDLSRNIAENLTAPRISQTFLLHQIHNSATVEKNLYRLPRCRAIFRIYTEDIDDYQSRRLARAYLSMQSQGIDIKKWSLLREAGLSKERIIETVNQLLKEISSE